MVENKCINPIGGGSISINDEGLTSIKDNGLTDSSIITKGIKKERYDALDGLRVIACIGIVLMHVKANIVVKPTSSFIMDNVISFTGDFVLMFMMVSAFGLCCGYFSKFKNGTISLDSFYSKRYKRILPFFGLLTMIDVALCMVSEQMHMTDALVAELWEAFANFTLAFGLIPGNDISVIGVGWFLGVIFLFYMLFPFFVFLMSTKKKAWITLVVVLGLYMSMKCYFAPVKGVSMANGSFMACAPYFIFGGLIYLYREVLTNLAKSTRILFGVLSIGYTVWFFVCPNMRFELADLLMYALWVMYAVSEASSELKWSLLNNKLMAFVSSISMEIYLCHMFIFRIVEKLHMENHIGNADVNYWLTCIFVLCGAACFALVWKKVEKKFILK